MLYIEWQVPLPRGPSPVLYKRKLSPAAVVVFLICVVTVYSGAKCIVFLRGADRVEDALGSASEAERQVVKGAKSFIANWKNAAGVADLVRSLSLAVVRAETPKDEAAIESAVSEIAENSPTSERAWQDLADARLAHGASMENVLAAFRLSDLTGSHEGYTMVRRATFGLEHWAELAEADRRIVVRDVAGTIDPYFKPQQGYRAILAAKSKVERNDIRAALTSSGLATPNVLQALGE